MNPRLLEYYNQELRYLREMGAEFAREYPKIAARLALDGLECADPYVERLLEGFAFLAGRVQLKIDSEFPNFTQHLLEAVFPHYVAPTPSMAVVQLQPEMSDDALVDGFDIPRGSILHSILGKGDRTACEYRTAHTTTLWPLEFRDVEYLPTPASVVNAGAPDLEKVKAGLRLRVRTATGVPFKKLDLKSLNVFLTGTDTVPMRIYEQLIGHAVATVIRPGTGSHTWHEVIREQPVRRVGFEPEQALLPSAPRSFDGYRLLHEYFAFPQRYLFVELCGLRSGVRRTAESELELIVLLDSSDSSLKGLLDISNFALYCTPAVNLFPRRADRIHLSDRTNEYHLVPDRTRPMDFEVHSVTEVTGYGTSADSEQEFLPFYASSDLTSHSAPSAYYTVRREPRRLSTRQHQRGPRTSYIGSEVYISLVDSNAPPYRSELRQLAVNGLCTNRDLPLLMPIGKGATDFTLEASAPIDVVRCLAGPSEPRPPWSAGETAWRLISHLSLNYLSLANTDQTQGAAALRELLSLYADVSDAALQKQIEGVQSASAVPVVRRIPAPGPIVFGRGLEVTLTCDEASFEGTSVFVLGAVLEAFFAKYVSLNSFTETVIRTRERGEIMRWPARMGLRQTL